MIEHKLGNSIPSRVVRFGVRHHGLVLTHAVKDPVFTEYLISFNDVRVLTRNGKNIPYPVIPLKFGATSGLQLTGKLGPSCMYMHPSAVMDAEDPDGNDWSGYIVFSLSGDYSSGGIVGYDGRSAFAYTPSHNGLGILITRIGSGSLSIKSKPNIIGEQNIGDEFKALNGVGGDPIFASKTGRELYFAALPTPLKIINEINYPDWPSTGAPKAQKITISDSIDNDDIMQYSFSVESIPVTVSDEYTVDGYETITYKQVTTSSPTVGMCVAPSDASVKVNTVEWSHLDPPDPYPVGGVSVVKLIDTYSLSRKKSVIAASISDDGEADFLSFLFEEYKKTDGGGDAQASGSVATGDICDEEFGYVSVTSTDITTSTSFSVSSVDRTRATLEGYGGSSTLELRFDSAASDSYSSRLINGTDEETTTTSDQNDTFTIEMDGAVLFSGSGYGGAGLDPIYEKPQLPTFYMTAPQGQFFGARLEEYGERKTGTKFLIVNARVCDYGSNDLRSLMAVVETGSLIKRGDIFVVNQDSYKAEVFIGKTFGRGVVDSYTHREDITRLSNYFLCRAYDPVDKKISPVYPYPVFYQ